MIKEFNYQDKEKLLIELYQKECLSQSYYNKNTILKSYGGRFESINETNETEEPACAKQVSIDKAENVTPKDIARATIRRRPYTGAIRVLPSKRIPSDSESHTHQRAENPTINVLPESSDPLISDESMTKQFSRLKIT